MSHPEFDNQIANNFFKLNGLLHQYIHDNVSVVDHVMTHMNYGQGKILAILVKQSPITQKELVEQLPMKPQSASELLQKLEKKALITREKSETDKRVSIVTLTEKGRLTATTERRDFVLPTSDVLTDEELIQFDQILNKLIAHIEPNVKQNATHHHHSDHHLH